MKLTFHGAAGEVTGSCYQVESREARFLVDCGLFQGGREAERKNRQFPAFDPEAIDFVLLTHAHIDHSGLLPRLCALGYKGPIYATPASADLLSVMLPDAAHIQEKEAQWATYSRRKAHPQGRYDTAPLYTVAQAHEALGHLKRIDYGVEASPHPSVRCVFRDAGHILGSAILEVWVRSDGKLHKLVFSGDLGQPGHPIVRDPAPVAEAGVLLVESTYGDRRHKSMKETLEELVYAIEDTLRRKRGNVVVPAFAVGRTQDLLFLLADLYRQGRLGPMNVYVDSPMAFAATEITLRHRESFDPEATTVMGWLAQTGSAPKIQFVQSVEESMALNQVQEGAIIISASGMCEAGRIKYHLKYNLPRPECTILITGFQAAGTLGRRLVDGAKRVRIAGEEIPVRAEIYTLGGLSAHADQAGLLEWLGHFKRSPQRTFVVHGEPKAASALAEAVRERLGWKPEIPQSGASVVL